MISGKGGGTARTPGSKVIFDNRIVRARIAQTAAAGSIEKNVVRREWKCVFVEQINEFSLRIGGAGGSIGGHLEVKWPQLSAWLGVSVRSKNGRRSCCETASEAAG